MNKLIDMSDVFNNLGYESIKRGSVVGFDNDGVIERYIIKSKRNGKVMAEKIKLYTLKEIDDMPDKDFIDLVGGKNASR